MIEDFGQEGVVPGGLVLVVADASGDSVRQFSLVGRNKLTVGRAPDRDLILRDPKVSRLHCVLYRERDVWCIADIESAGGTWVEGSRVLWKRLRPGRIANVGDYQLSISHRPIAPKTATTRPTDAYDDATTNAPNDPGEWDLASDSKEATTSSSDTMVPDPQRPWDVAVGLMTQRNRDQARQSKTPNRPDHDVQSTEKSVFLNDNADFIPLMPEDDDQNENDPFPS